MKLEFESNVAVAPSFAGNYSADVESAEEKDVSRMLQAGVKAAQNGNRAEARVLLLQITEAAPDNENAWLWLASISDYPEELLIFLNNVLNINPNNARALEWAYATKSLLAKNFVQRGVDASNEARMDLAKQCFLQAVVHDERNEMAWFWLASISDSADEKLSHLQKVLSINPENETALSALQITKSQATESLMRKANMAAIAGERDAAGEMLQRILKQTPDLEDAWILKSYLADSFSDKVICYEKVLSINPENDAATSGLTSLREMMARTETRKSQSLAVVAAFMADTPAENPTKVPSELISANEVPEGIVEFGEVIEDAQIVSEEAETENPTTRETELLPAMTELLPAKIELANNSYSYRSEILKEIREATEKDISANFQEPETTEPDDYQAYDYQMDDYQAGDYRADETAAEPENLQTAETAARWEDYQTTETAEMITDEAAATESEDGGAFSNAPPSYADYNEQEIYTAPNDEREFIAETAPAAVYSASVEAAEPFREAVSAVKKIMVIDDSATVRKLIAQKLEANGYEVICSADGIEALETIKAVVPDLILLDTAMPQMDGYQICHSIRNNEATKNVPVVMISGKDGFFDKVRGQMSGSTGYIAKPFGPETLMKTVENYIVQ